MAVMMQDKSDVILGLDAMGELFGRTRGTMRRWIDSEGFPAFQLPSGQWCTDADMIHGWIETRVVDRWEQEG